MKLVTKTTTTSDRHCSLLLLWSCIILLQARYVSSFSIFPSKSSPASFNKVRSPKVSNIKKPLVEHEQRQAQAAQLQQQQHQDQHKKPYVPTPHRLEFPHFTYDESTEDELRPLRSGLLNSATAATLQLVTSFVPKDDTESSDKAARIVIHQLPPKSIELDLRDIPLFGSMLSGTWARVAPLKTTKPSIVVESPKEKFNAIRDLLDHGSLEFDISGWIKTHLEVNVEPNQKGQAILNLKSKLIPKLPWSKSKPSQWNRVTNLGTGQSYYFNTVSGETQFQAPAAEME